MNTSPLAPTGEKTKLRATVESLMKDYNDRQGISPLLAEFYDRDMEGSFQDHTRSANIRQLRIVLVASATLLMLFAIPDYTAMGFTRPFYHLLAFRVVMSAVLLLLYFMITPETGISRISYPLTIAAVIYYTGFMIFFVYMPDATYLVIGVILIQLIAFPIIFPIRFVMAALVVLYGLAVTLVTRFLLGTTLENLVSLFVIMLLPVAFGILTAHRFGILHRREYAMLVRAEEINRELQKALAEKKKLTGMLPICASCKKIRNDQGYWEQIEAYIREHSEAEFSHGICPECITVLYPELSKKR